MSTIFATAVDDGLIASNPVTTAHVGSRGRKARIALKASVEKIRPFTQEQVTAILEWCDARDQELGDFVFTLLRTGCRPGEARALKWRDIGNDKILIERSVDDLNVVTPTKTGAVREVDMTPALKDVLRLRRLKRERAGHCVGADDYVFGNGTPITARGISHRFDQAMKECEIEGHVMYDCRHSYASTLLQRCRDVVYTAKMLGHSSAVTTLKYYAHYLQTTSTRYADLLDEPAGSTERAPLGDPSPKAI